MPQTGMKVVIVSLLMGAAATAAGVGQLVIPMNANNALAFIKIP